MAKLLGHRSAVSVVARLIGQRTYFDFKEETKGKFLAEASTQSESCFMALDQVEATGDGSRAQPDFRLRFRCLGFGLEQVTVELSFVS